jgi:hypothetical protein
VTAQRYDTIAVHLHDPREQTLPSVGLLELTDAETGQFMVIDTGSSEVRRLYAQRAQERLDTLHLLFKQLQLDVVSITTNEGYIEPLAQFFRQRNRRLGR